MYIKNIRLKNYRSLIELDLSLSPLNVLIGSNGSGKSNFLSLFNLLKHAADGKFQDYIDDEIGGFNHLQHFNAPRTEIGQRVFIGLTIERLQTLNNIRVAEGFRTGMGEFTIEIGGRIGQGYIIKSEEITRPPYPNQTNSFRLLRAESGRVRNLSALPSLTSEPETEPFQLDSETELALSVLRDPRYPTLNEIRREIVDWQMLRGFGSDALANMRRPQELRVPRMMRLDDKASNLVSILYQLGNRQEYSNHNRQLNEALKAAFDDFDRLDIPMTEGNSAMLHYRSNELDQPVPAHLMSDGQLRFIGLATTLLQPEPPSLLAIDEPEVGLHPKLLHILAELIQYAAQRTQLVISTHSTVLLSKLAPENILVTTRDGGQTFIRRLDSERLKKWLNRYTLGELWEVGRLEQ